MEITPHFGEEIITAAKIEIRVNPEDRARAEALVATTGAITGVSSEVTFHAARNAAAQLKAMLDEIAADKKRAKLPFAAVETSIETAATRVSKPVKAEHTRILELLNGYVEKLEKEKKERDRLEAVARRIAQEQADKKLRIAQEEARLAQEQLRKAEGELAKARHREELQRREDVLLQQQLAQELAADVEELGKEPPKALVPGGRVDHVYDFKLVNIQAVCDARCFRLLRWELDIPACRDSVKSQLEGLPEIEPSLPGIEITKRVSVSVKGASRIS